MSTAGTTTPETLERYVSTLSNWGRWGPDDERGSVNYISPEIRLRAAGLVRSGRAVSLARSVDPMKGFDPRRPVTHLLYEYPLDHSVVHGDFLGFIFHGREFTHIDCFSHFFHNGLTYNGFPATSADFTGVQRCAVESYREGISGRGVLLDIARQRGVPGLYPDEQRVSRADLEAAERAEGITVGEGDIVFVRTGGDVVTPSESLVPLPNGVTGCDPSVLPWLHERRVAVLGSDTVNDGLPSGIEGWTMPIHLIGLVYLGLPLVDNAELEALAVACEEEGRWEFHVTLAPLRLGCTTGSPLNPIAIF